jgi:DNA-binding transcriptional LysR family regulator
MELNTLDAFRGVVRQGEIIALLPKGALVEASQDPTLAVRPIAPPPDSASTPSSNGKLKSSLTRQVVLVTTSDRLQIPPIAHFCHLVRQLIHVPDSQLSAI